jgi:hypothetical protein
MDSATVLTPAYLSALTVFTAGGITDCPDWQGEVPALLAGLLPGRPVVVLNPRRPSFPIDDPTAAAGQVAWEYAHLRLATAVLFWFPGGPSVQPIAFGELLAMAEAGRPIAVGADPGYLRQADVVLQLGHARPDVVVRDSLAAACADLAALLVR